jgi:hypothetical protein
MARHTLTILLAALCLCDTSAAIARTEDAATPTACPPSTRYSAAARKSAEALLETRYGRPQPFDVDRISLFELLGLSGIVTTANGTAAQVDPDEVDWQVFNLKKEFQTHQKKLPGSVIVAFDRCSERAIGFKAEP